MTKLTMMTYCMDIDNNNNSFNIKPEIFVELKWENDNLIDTEKQNKVKAIFTITNPSRLNFNVTSILQLNSGDDNWEDLKIIENFNIYYNLTAERLIVLDKNLLNNEKLRIKLITEDYGIIYSNEVSYYKLIEPIFKFEHNLENKDIYPDRYCEMFINEKIKFKVKIENITQLGQTEKNNLLNKIISLKLFYEDSEEPIKVITQPISEIKYKILDDEFIHEFNTISEEKEFSLKFSFEIDDKIIYVSPYFKYNFKNNFITYKGKILNNQNLDITGKTGNEKIGTILFEPDILYGEIKSEWYHNVKYKLKRNDITLQVKNNYSDTPIPISFDVNFIDNYNDFSMEIEFYEDCIGSFNNIYYIKNTNTENLNENVIDTSCTETYYMVTDSMIHKDYISIQNNLSVMDRVSRELAIDYVDYNFYEITSPMNRQKDVKIIIRETDKYWQNIIGIDFYYTKGGSLEKFNLETLTKQQLIDKNFIYRFTNIDTSGDEPIYLYSIIKTGDQLEDINCPDYNLSLYNVIKLIPLF